MVCLVTIPTLVLELGDLLQIALGVIACPTIQGCVERWTRFCECDHMIWPLVVAFLRANCVPAWVVVAPGVGRACHRADWPQWA